MSTIFRFFKNIPEHLVHLEKVLWRLKAAGLKKKPSKCAFAKSSVTFLGHKIFESGLAPDPEKVRAIQSFPQPHNLRTLRGWLGTINYFRHFSLDWSKLEEPLARLLMKDVPFVWTDRHQSCFEEQKRRLTSAPILAHFDQVKPIELHTDASAVGVGAVLIQKTNDEEHVIAYASKTLNKAQKNYGAIELELLQTFFEWKNFTIIWAKIVSSKLSPTIQLSVHFKNEKPDYSACRLGNEVWPIYFRSCLPGRKG